MARTNKIIDASSDQVDEAKRTAIALVSETASAGAIDDLFYSDNLEKVEAGIRRLNDLSNKSWILSAILLYTLIYNSSLYQQSGLTWNEYSKHARERLGLDPRDITEQLSAARFFIRHHAAMERYGWTPKEANRKLARAELALELCGDIDEVLRHLADDSWLAFKEWYSSYKSRDGLPKPTEYSRDDIDIRDRRVYIRGVEAVRVSDEIPEQDRERIEGYIAQVFSAMRMGCEPAIVPVYDEAEARALIRLRDRYRREK